MLEFLQGEISDKIKEIAEENLLEVRIRAGKEIKITYSSDSNEIKKASLPIVMTRADIEKCILKLANFSLFSAEEHLKRGFITSKEGERVGFCGDAIGEGKDTYIKNVTSLCVRFPKENKGIAEEFFNKYIVNSPKSCLIISPPFHGKTTFIRDLSRLYSYKLDCNVLYIDERNEFSASGKFDLGDNADIIRYSTKEYGFKTGVRSLNPDVIVCDELMNERDVLSANFAILSGVKVISSIHADELKNILKKQEISANLKSFTFDYFVELYEFKIRKVYDSDMVEIC